MRKIVMVFIVSILPGMLLFGQMTINLQVDQPAALRVQAGNNIVVCAGSKIQLGDQLIVQNNIGDVFYNWYPAEKLDDPTSPNPTLIVGNSASFVVTVIDSRGCSVQDEIKVKAGLCDDLVKQSEGSLKVYPNPTSGFLNIDLPISELDEEINVRIVNALGQSVFQDFQHGRSGEMSLKISLERINPGIYFVQLISGSKLFVERIQIQ